LFGHERRNLHADVEHRPSETQIAALAENFFESRASEVAGKEKYVVSHAIRAYVVPKPLQ
jgi:hypothetical protein